MYQSNRTPGIWQQPTPQQTFSETKTSKPAATSGYLRERLRSEPPEKEDASSESDKTETLDVGAAFFHRLAKTSHQTKPQSKVRHAQQTPATSSPGSGTDDLPFVDELKHGYSVLAGEIHGDTVNRLREIQSELEAAVTDAAKQDKKFLDATSQQKLLTHSLNAERAEFEIVDKGRKSVKLAQVGESIKRSADRLSDLEAEVHQLWDQWEETQSEISTILQELTSQGTHSRRSYDKNDAEPATLAAEIRTEFKQDVKGLEKELAGIMQETMDNAKAVEKEARGSATRVIAGFVQRSILD